ncbi:MAG: alpha/beta hydrolase [Hyphomicrobiales bacterium]|nr:MAG: alpha/beta hydrolase [Hyphomicrobiales bacterium]
MTTVVLIAIGVLISVVCAGIIAEALRIAPKPPEKLYWAPNIAIREVEIDGNRIRYIKTGSGPNLVLLHTLRTQLDIFEKLVPLLEESFTVYALDYPGHGFSDIPQTDYRPELFVSAVEGFLDKLGLTDVTLAGISIGGVIPLLIAAEQNPRVNRVVAINPYDYGQGSGLARANAVAALIVTLGKVPVVGETVMRLRNAMVERRSLEGGVADRATLTPEFLAMSYASGLRRGHYRAFLNLRRHAHLWDEARRRYGEIGVPVLVVYGEEDWSRPEERQRTVAAIPGARMETVQRGGHFLSLDQPKRLAELITAFART